MNKWLIITFVIMCIIFISWIIREQIKENMLQDDPKLLELRALFDKVFYKNRKYNGELSRLNNRNIMDEITLYKGEKSYSINKHKVFLCLKDEKDVYYNNNILIYVLSHELAHCINRDNIGHTQEFYDIFEEVLDLMAQEGIYNPSLPIPSSYCTFNDKKGEENTE